MSYVFFVFAAFFAITGLLYCLINGSDRLKQKAYEPFRTDINTLPEAGGVLSDSVSYKCPTLLIQHGNQLMLYRDSYLVARFSSIEDYAAYMERQYRELPNVKRTDLQGRPIPIEPCPVLFLTPESNVHGQTVYRQNPDPIRSANSGNSEDNDNSKPDKMDRVRTFNDYQVDKRDSGAYINGEIGDPRISDNAMARNWGGVLYTQQMIDSGKYDRRTVGKPVTAANIVGLPSV